MKNLLLLSALGCLATAANAQYLPNSGFESWKSTCGQTYQTSDKSSGSNPVGFRTRPGKEPADWNGSSVDQHVILTAKKELISQGSHNDGASVVMKNDFVGVFGIGSNAPAFVNFGTPWVYAITDIANCDGGVYGGTEFTFRPDAIRGSFKRTGGTGENAHIIAYLWQGTFTSKVPSVNGMTFDDVDRVVMGRSTEDVTQQGQLIASCDYAFATTENDDWQEIEVPLTYVEGQENAVPEKMNVILSSADYWTRSNIKKGSVLEADDVQFVYYHDLSSLTYGEYTLKTDAGQTDFDFSSVAYDPSLLSYTVKGAGATAEASYDEETALLTITVYGNDYSVNQESKTTYRLQFQLAKPKEAALAAASFDGMTVEISNTNDTEVFQTYSTDRFTLTATDPEATIERSYDMETGVLTVTVKASDYAESGTQATYLFRFFAPEQVYTFNDDLTVNIDGMPMAQTATIKVARMNTSCYFMELADFTLEGIGGVGTIFLENMTPELGGLLRFQEEQTINILPGSDPEAMWIGPMLGPVPVTLNGTLLEESQKLFHANIDINFMGMNIGVVFGTPIVEVTTQAAVAESGDAHVVLRRQFDEGWSTVCLPFAFEAAELADNAELYAFTGVKDNLLSFDKVEGTAQANVPYLLHMPATIYQGRVLRSKTLAAGEPESVTFGDYTFAGTYAPAAAEQLYTVAAPEGEPQFVPAEAEAQTAGTYAYLADNGEAASVYFISLDGKTPTAIGQATQTLSADGPAYNLQGVKVADTAKNLPAGLYIVNGRKVIVK